MCLVQYDLETFRNSQVGIMEFINNLHSVNNENFACGRSIFKIDLAESVNRDFKKLFFI